MDGLLKKRGVFVDLTLEEVRKASVVTLGSSE
jgi:hypothetical protein